MARTKRKTVDGAVKRLLVYTNRKCDPIYWDASTPELEAGAFLALFKTIDESWRCYASLTEAPYQPPFPKDHPEGCMCEQCAACRTYKDRAPKEGKENERQLEAYKLAKAGDADAARRLLTARKDHEYERFAFSTVGAETATYAPRTWGVKKPCGAAYVCNNGLVLWGNHNRLGYSLKANEKAAIKWLTDGGKDTAFSLNYDPDTKKKVTIETPWKFEPYRERKKDESKEEYACRILGAEPEQGALAAVLLERGSIVPGKVLVFTKQVCPPCKRDLERFDL
jgi:hypothetical protein